VNNPWPALVVGAVLVGLGVVLIVSHVRTWHDQRTDPALDEADRLYYQRRFRRRVQVSGMLALIGVLIAVGDTLLPLQRQPLWTTLYWIGVLLLLGWVILLGFGDFWSTAARAKIEMARMRQRRRELERQIVEFKHRLDTDRDQ
jgi:hypothetical protein